MTRTPRPKAWCHVLQPRAYAHGVWKARAAQAPDGRVPRQPVRLDTLSELRGDRQRRYVPHLRRHRKDRQVIGQSLKRARTNRGWSTQQTADELGVAKSTYCAYEASGSLPANEVLDRIAEQMPELANRIAEVRKLRPRTSRFARAAVGGQTTEVAEREHQRHKAAAERRRT